MTEKYKVRTNFLRIYDIIFTKEESYIIVCGDSQDILFISHTDKSIEMTLSSNSEAILDMDLSPDNNFLVAAGEGPNLSILDIKSQKNITTSLFFDICKKIQFLESFDAYYIPKKIE